MILHLSDYSPEPLHQQISRQIREKILAGDLREDDPLPSIRGLAREHRVSVITVQRAYDDLAHEGLLLSRRGKGFFVKAGSMEKKQQIATERLTEQLSPIFNEAFASGLSREAILGIIRSILGGK